CTECGDRTVKYDAFKTLSLAIPAKAKAGAGAEEEERTLEDCLSAFESPSLCPGVDCTVCMSKVTKSTRQCVALAPTILVLQLKRFPSPSAKDVSPVSFGPSAAFGTPPLPYELTGVVSHRGRTLKSGHYTANVRVGGGIPPSRRKPRRSSSASSSPLVDPTALLDPSGAPEGGTTPAEEQSESEEKSGTSVEGGLLLFKAQPVRGSSE
ncbi:hypothetical protein TrRE_jg1062, partial [Triparma retinervis]